MCALVPSMLPVVPDNGFRAPCCSPLILASCFNFCRGRRARRWTHHAVTYCAGNSLLMCLQIRPRDFCWASEGDVVPLSEYLDELRVSSCIDFGLHMYHFSAMQGLCYHNRYAELMASASSHSPHPPSEILVDYACTGNGSMRRLIRVFARYRTLLEQMGDEETPFTRQYTRCSTSHLPLTSLQHKP